MALLKVVLMIVALVLAVPAPAGAHRDRRHATAAVAVSAGAAAAGYGARGAAAAGYGSHEGVAAGEWAASLLSPQRSLEPVLKKAISQAPAVKGWSSEHRVLAPVFFSFQDVAGRRAR